MTKSTFLLTTTILLGALPCKGADDIDALKADMSFFTEPSCRELKDGVGKGDLGRFKSEVLDRQAVLREGVDEAELLVEDRLWPLPKYHEMLGIY